MMTPCLDTHSILDAKDGVKLLLFSTNRAIKTYLQKNPKNLTLSMTIGEFFQKILTYQDRVILSSKTLRLIVLSNVMSNFKDKLLEHSFIFEKSFKAYLQSSDFFLNFYDELFAHGCDIKDIKMRDIYAEYDDHLMILEEVHKNYCNLLAQNGYIDRSRDFEILSDYLINIDGIEIFLDGILNAFEIDVLHEVSKVCNIIFHINTGRVERKIEGLDNAFKLAKDTYYKIAFPSGEILESRQISLHPSIKVAKTISRIAQVGAIREQIKKWLDQGVESSHITIILPDRDFIKYLNVLEKNVNFAMGNDFALNTLFLSCKAALIEQANFYKDQNLVEKIGEICENIYAILATKMGKDIRLSSIMQDVKEILENYKKIAKFLNGMSVEDFYEYFIDALSKLNVDDVNGGKISTMGVLETRGIDLEYVILPDCNQDRIPSFSENDLFLNSTIRESLGMPLAQDKQNLQLHYYEQLIRRSKEAFLIFVDNEDSLPSVLLDKLELERKEFSFSNVALFEQELRLKKPAFRQDILLAPLPGVECKKDARYLERVSKLIQIPLKIPSHFSPSSLEVFLSCRANYYFRYICDVSCEEERSSERKGIKVHKILELAYRQHVGEILTPSRIKDSKKYALAECKKQVDENGEKLEISDILELRLLSFELERFFEVEENRVRTSEIKLLGVEEEVNFALEGMSFRGRVDRIEQSYDEIEILDYKHVRDVDNMLRNERDYSLDIYAAAIALKYPSVSNIKTAFYKLRDKVEITPSLNSKKMGLGELVKQLKLECEQNDADAPSGVINYMREVCGKCEYSVLYQK